ncbi:methyltransferase domain-containing protein [Flammeovirgaceae bacterium SG7u.111]|nr:methyltransferase domain-containing protein [Flammeovirgaceae bacterium SG7u.132]WPO38721.1 methyltransferase domain-containing protein [Flammeovirgaceae bacterium SG7u.111]
MKNLLFSFIFLSVLLSSCASQKGKNKPYACGRVFTKKEIKESFATLAGLLELKPGDAFADVGSQNGAVPVMLSSLVDSLEVYVQDIDTACLSEQELGKVLAYYSKLTEKPLRENSSFQIAIGTYTQTNLPAGYFDVIYTNATYHVIEDKEAVMNDIFTKLKDDGHFFVRDEFVEEGEVKICPGEDCGVPFASEKELLSQMEKSGFKLVQKWDDFSGYPVYKFGK